MRDEFYHWSKLLFAGDYGSADGAVVAPAAVLLVLNVTGVHGVVVLEVAAGHVVVLLGGRRRWGVDPDGAVLYLGLHELGDVEQDGKDHDGNDVLEEPSAAGFWAIHGLVII